MDDTFAEALTERPGSSKDRRGRDRESDQSLTRLQRTDVAEIASKALVRSRSSDEALTARPESSKDRRGKDRGSDRKALVRSRSADDRRGRSSDADWCPMDPDSKGRSHKTKAEFDKAQGAIREDLKEQKRQEAACSNPERPLNMGRPRKLLFNCNKPSERR